MNNNDSFNSIDHLMEFGLSMAVANQTMQTINSCIQQMPTMGVNGFQANVQEDKSSCYCVIDGKQAGPFEIKELKMLVKKGILTANTLIWRQGLTAWTFAKNVPEIYKEIILNQKSTI